MAVLSCAALIFSGCGDDDGVTDASMADAGARRAFTLDFAAVVGDSPFACGQTYEELGPESRSWTATDLRFYVHDVVVSDGVNDYPVQLDDDGRWQNGQVALLDFEDGCGDMGNADVNTTIRGMITATATDLVGVSFRIGVPEALNHANAATADAPLNLTAMFWNWNGGYKHMRIEGPSDVFDAWRLHLGSTMCTGDMMGNATCMTPNRPLVDLRGSTPVTSVEMDLGALWESSTFTNVEDTPPGCMSSPTDTDCGPIFSQLGLAFGDEPAQGQRIFSIR